MFSPKRTIACWEATDEITSGFQAQANDLGFVFKFQQSWEENVNFEGKPGNVSSHAATTTSRPETVAQNPDEARMRDVSTSSWIFLSTMQICIALLSCSCCRGAVCGLGVGFGGTMDRVSPVQKLFKGPFSPAQKIHLSLQSGVFPLKSPLQHPSRCCSKR